MNRIFRILALLSTLITLPCHAGSLIDRVVLVTPSPEPETTRSLADALGNGFHVTAATPDSFSKLQGVDVAIIALPSADAAKSAIADASAMPTIDRIILTTPASSKNRKDLEAKLAEIPANPKLYRLDPSLLPASAKTSDRCRQWAMAIVQPEDTGANLKTKLLGAWKNEGVQPSEPRHGLETLTVAKRGIHATLPQHPRPGLHPVWVAADPADPAVETLSKQFLSRGFPILTFTPTAEVTSPETAQAYWRGIYDQTVRAGFNRQIILVTGGKQAASAVEWATQDPWRIQALHMVNPELPSLEHLAKLATFNRWDKAGVAISLIAGGKQESSGIIRLLETSAGPSLVSKDRALPQSSFEWIHRNSHLMSAMERYITRERFTPQYKNLPEKEILARHATSGWGDKPQRLRPGQNYFKGNPSGFDKTESQWRTERGLVRNGGVLKGPSICLTPDELNKAPKPAVLLKTCTDAFGELAWHWEEDCRTPEDSARIQSLILDLAELTTIALRKWNDAETAIPGNQYDIKALNRLAGISAILPPDQSYWLGQLALSDLKDRFKEEPYNDMDILRWTSMFPASINFFRDPATKCAHLVEIADYFDRTFHTNTGCGMEGTPQHHGKWHYSYASYSIGSGYGVLRGFHNLGIHFSKNTYDRFKKTAVNMALHSRPDLYNSVAPIAYNARVGLECYLRWQAVADACFLGDGKDPSRPDPALLAVLATVDPSGKTLAELAAKGIKAPDKPAPNLLLINSGALVTRQYKRLQAAISCMSGPFGASSEIYMNWAGNYYSLYLKAGSILLRSPAADNAERFNHYDGFDHSFIPGATSIVSTDRELFCRGVHTGVSTNGIGGGTLFTDNESAILATATTVGPMPMALKSYFIFGDRITALTSNIRRWTPDMEKQTGRNSSFLTITDPNRPIVTTLYQWPSTDSMATESTETKTLEKAAALTDRYGHSYVIHPNPQATIHTRSGLQSYISLDKKKLKPGRTDFSSQCELRHALQGRVKHDDLLDSYETTTGHWTRSWIEHRKTDGSDDAAAAFTLLVGGAREKAEELAKSIDAGNSPYRILQQDHRAHILKDTQSSTTGYVIFEGGETAATGEILESSSAPCFLMLRNEPDTSVSASFVNADSKARKAVRLVLRGKWSLKGSGETLDDGTRVTILPCGDNTEITLHAPACEDFLTFGPAATATYYQTRHLLPATFSLTKKSDKTSR